MRYRQNWWKRKCIIAAKAVIFMVLSILLCSGVAVYYANADILGLPVPYWMFMIVLPGLLLNVFFRHNRLDQANDRFNDHTGIG